MTIEQLVDPDESNSAVARLSRPWHDSKGVTVMRGVGWTLIYAGFLILGFVVHQLFITNIFAQRAQDTLESELAVRIDDGAQTFAYVDPATGDVVEVPEFDPTVGGGSSGGGVDLGEFEDRLFAYESAPDLGEALGTIRIPDIGLDWTIVEGVRLSPDLKKGAGHYPDTPIPGQAGNAGIAGHRTTYGQPFHDLGELNPGDRVFWDSATGTHEYEVREVFVVRPSELWVLDNRDGAWLTLTTCHPKWSATERLIVVSEMVGGPNFGLFGEPT
ncbi:MAG: sortase [Acidimicrobiia bacterium]|nr:sortase [Acidimicrobiia bacterium]